MPKIAIIGGGISGIAAALELTQNQAEGQSIEFVLFEAAPRLGGVLETVRVGDYLIEKSADNFATLVPDALQLTDQFGSVDSLIAPVETDRRALVLHKGLLEPIPPGFSLMQPTNLRSILATRTLSWPGKIRLACEPFVRARKQQDDESLTSFATRRLGKEAFENLVDPIVSGIFTADPTQLSMQATMPQFLEMERKHGSLVRAHYSLRKTNAQAAAAKASGARYDQFRAPVGGMSQWIQDLSRSIPDGNVQLGAEVTLVRRQGNRWLLSSGQQEATFDGLILATPAAVTQRLLQNAYPAASQLVGSVTYASSVVLACIVAKSALRGRIDAFGLVCPTKENRQALAISYTSNKYSGRVPDDEILLRVFLGGSLRPEVVDLDDTRIEEIAHREMRDILGWDGSQLRWQSVIRWKNAMPQYTLGHVQRMEELQREIQSIGQLQLCGAAYQGVGIPQCVRSGRRAAKDILTSLD